MWLGRLGDPGSQTLSVQCDDGGLDLYPVSVAREARQPEGALGNHHQSSVSIIRCRTQTAPRRTTASRDRPLSSLRPFRAGPLTGVTPDSDRRHAACVASRPASCVRKQVALCLRVRHGQRHL